MTLVTMWVQIEIKIQSCQYFKSILFHFHHKYCMRSLSSVLLNEIIIPDLVGVQCHVIFHGFRFSKSLAFLSEYLLFGKRKLLIVYLIFNHLFS